MGTSSHTAHNAQAVLMLGWLMHAHTCKDIGSDLLLVATDGIEVGVIGNVLEIRLVPGAVQKHLPVDWVMGGAWDWGTARSSGERVMLKPLPPKATLWRHSRYHALWLPLVVGRNGE